MIKITDEKNSSNFNINLNGNLIEGDKNKLKFELTDAIPKLNFNRIKLLKPKQMIYVSNGASEGCGGQLNLMKINLNLLNNNKYIDACQKSKNLPQITQNQKNSPPYENFRFKCENILKHPKSKNLKKIKECTNKNYCIDTNITENELNETNNQHLIIDNKRDDYFNQESKNFKKEKDLLDSTNVSYMNLNSNNHNIQRDQKISNFKTDKNKIPNNNQNFSIDDISKSNHSLDIKHEGVKSAINMKSNKENSYTKPKLNEMNLDYEFYYQRNVGAKINQTLDKNLKCLKKTNIQSNKNNENTCNNHFNISNIDSPADKSLPLSNLNKQHLKSRNQIKINKSCLLKTTKTLLDTSHNLSNNLEILVKKLRTNKSISHKKEEKVEILKNMVEGLTKLTTIMLEDTESEKSDTKDNKSHSNKKNTNNYTYDNNNLLISSTTGQVIKQKQNGKIFDLHKNKNYNINTIDYEQTIYKDDKIDNTDYNRSKNKNNNSLIMLINNNDEQENYNKNYKKENIKNLKENRYNSSSSMTLRSIQQNKAGISDYKQEGTKTNKKNKKDLTNLSTIENRDYIIINKNNNYRNYLNNLNHFTNTIDNNNNMSYLTTNNAANKKFLIDKFDFRISKNFYQKTQEPMRIFDTNSNYTFSIDSKNEKLKNMRVPKIVKKNDTIDIDDILPNYEFVD